MGWLTDEEILNLEKAAEFLEENGCWQESEAVSRALEQLKYLDKFPEEPKE